MNALNTVFQLSLLASFIAGMVALFAPCCITFLLPAYFANIFKEKRQILLMTLIYSLGIFTIMLPVVLGAKVLSDFFFRLHDQTYIVGGLFLVFVALLSLFGVKLPMPRLNPAHQTTDPLSTYTLGIFSGITSACCAPVLVGVIALSSLSPSLLQSLLVGIYYVFGMVMPLYLASLFIDKRNLLEKPVFRKVVFQVNIFDQNIVVLFSNLVAFAMFTLIGLTLIFLSISGRLEMDNAETSATRMIQSAAISITNLTSNLPMLDISFIIFSIVFIYFFLKSVISKSKLNDH